MIDVSRPIFEPADKTLKMTIYYFVCDEEKKSFMFFIQFTTQITSKRKKKVMFEIEANETIKLN